MSIEIDGFAVLGAIAGRPELFTTAKPDVVKVAKGFVLKQIKDKSLAIGDLKAIAEALSFANFDLIADGMSDAEIKALLAKVDKLNGAIRSAAADEQRKHLSQLAQGTLAPAADRSTPAKTPKRAPAVRPKVERSGNVSAMRAKKKV